MSTSRSARAEKVSSARVCVDVVQKARQDHGKVVELRLAVVIHVGQIDDIRDEIAQLAHLSRNRSLGDRLVALDRISPQ